MPTDPDPDPDPAARGRELEAVLELAAMFPARHGRYLDAPVFGRRAEGLEADDAQQVTPE